MQRRRGHSAHVRPDAKRDARLDQRLAPKGERGPHHARAPEREGLRARRDGHAGLGIALVLARAYAARTLRGGRWGSTRGLSWGVAGVIGLAVASVSLRQGGEWVPEESIGVSERLGARTLGGECLDSRLGRRASGPSVRHRVVRIGPCAQLRQPVNACADSSSFPVREFPCEQRLFFAPCLETRLQSFLAKHLC
eukprot:3786686-Pleurochrysis_carterae.AAC.2